MDNDSFYSKLAKSGWLGTKAQVSQQYGKPIWKSNDGDPVRDALLKAKQNAGARKETDDESNGQ